MPRIVSTVADTYGVLPHSMSESLRSKAENQLTPHEAVIRSFGYHERLTPDEHAQVRRILDKRRVGPGARRERCVGNVPVELLELAGDGIHL